MSTTLTSLAAVTLTVASVVACPAARAQEATPDTWITQSRSVASRADVRDELRAAQASGAFMHGEAAGHDFTRAFRPMLARLQIATEAAEARRLGLTLGGEVQRFPTLQEIEAIRDPRRRAGHRAQGRPRPSRRAVTAIDRTGDGPAGSVHPELVEGPAGAP